MSERKKRKVYSSEFKAKVGPEGHRLVDAYPDFQSIILTHQL